LHRRGILPRQLTLADVIRAALGAEHQEAVQARPVVDRPGEPTGVVLLLAASRDWLPLRSGLLRNCPCVPHVTSFDQPSASPVGTGILAVLDAERREKKTVATSATHDEP